MKQKRSSRNSFLFGSGDMSYSCKHIYTQSKNIIIKSNKKPKHRLALCGAGQKSENDDDDDDDNNNNNNSTFFFNIFFNIYTSKNNNNNKLIISSFS